MAWKKTTLYGDEDYEVAVVCKFIDGVIPKQKQENQLKEILTLKVA